MNREGTQLNPQCFLGKVCHFLRMKRKNCQAGQSSRCLILSPELSGWIQRCLAHLCPYVSGILWFWWHMYIQVARANCRNFFSICSPCVPSPLYQLSKGEGDIEQMGTKGLKRRRLSFISLSCMAHFHAGQFPSINQSSAYVLCSYLEASQGPSSVSYLQRKQMSTGASFTFCSLSPAATPKIARKQEIYHWHLIK